MHWLEMVNVQFRFSFVTICICKSKGLLAVEYSMVKWYRRWVSDLAPRIWFSLMPLSVSFFSPNLKRLRLTNKEIRKAEIWIETTEFYVSVSKKGNGSGSSCWNVDSAFHWINHYRVDKYQPRSQASLLPREPWERGWISIRKNDWAIPWIETYPADSVIHLLNNRGQNDRIECRTKERGSRLFPLLIVLRSGEASVKKEKNVAIFLRLPPWRVSSASRSLRACFRSPRKHPKITPML